MQKDIVVVGAGGHAKVCIEVLRAMGERIAYCVGVAGSPAVCVGVPVLNGDENLEALFHRGYRRVFVALGANTLRERLGRYVRNLGYEVVTAVSPSALVSPSARLGRGVVVMAGAVINAEALVGDFSVVNTGATVDHECRLGVAVHIAPQCGLAGNVVVGDHAFLGIGSSVIPDVTIGHSTIIGAGSVVLSNIGDAVTAVGIPARVIRNSEARTE